MAQVLKYDGGRTSQYHAVILCRLFSVSREPAMPFGAAWLWPIPWCLGPNLGPRCRPPSPLGTQTGVIGLLRVEGPTPSALTNEMSGSAGNAERISARDTRQGHFKGPHGRAS